MKFRKKPVEVEAITFDELVQYGTTHRANIVNGMPWSFDYGGYPITHVIHEDDNCYLIPTLKGTVPFRRGDMLVTGEWGYLLVVEARIFKETHESVNAVPATNVAVCDTCHKNPPSHDLYGVLNKRQLCCRCYVREGNLPADWHPDCMNEWRVLQAERTAR